MYTMNLRIQKKSLLLHLSSWTRVHALLYMSQYLVQFTLYINLSPLTALSSTCFSLHKLKYLKGKKTWREAFCFSFNPFATFSVRFFFICEIFAVFMLLVASGLNYAITPNLFWPLGLKKPNKVNLLTREMGQRGFIFTWRPSVPQNHFGEDISRPGREYQCPSKTISNKFQTKFLTN